MPWLAKKIPPEHSAALRYITEMQKIQGTQAEIDAEDSLAFLKGVLKEYGLDSMAVWAWSQLRQGRSQEEVMIALYEQPQFKARFPAIEERRRKKLAPISPAQYVAYERDLNQLLVSTGIVRFYGKHSQTVAGPNPGSGSTIPAAFGELVNRLLVADVSMDEVAKRVSNGFQRVAQSDPRVRAEFQRLFGVQGDAALAAYFLDPANVAPRLEEEAGMAVIGGAAQNFGFTLGQNYLRRIEDRGVDFNTAIDAFSELSALDPLFRETVGEGAAPKDDLKAEEDGLDLMFGIDGEGRRKIEQRRSSRLAAFGGGDVAVTRTGLALGAGDVDA